jgi:hypothetical protein
LSLLPNELLVNLFVIRTEAGIHNIAVFKNWIFDNRLENDEIILLQKCNYSAHRAEILKKVLDRVFGEIFSFPPQLTPACFPRLREPLRDHGAD